MVTTRLRSLTQEDGEQQGQQPASTAAASSQDTRLLVFKSGGLVWHGGGQFVEKCEFGAKVVRGGCGASHEEGGRPAGAPPAQTVQDLQAFLGTVNFYHRFLPAAASLLQALTVERSEPRTRFRSLHRWRLPSPASRPPSPTPPCSHTPPPDLPHGGRLREPRGRSPTAAALTLFKLAAIGIFFKKI